MPSTRLPWLRASSILAALCCVGCPEKDAVKDPPKKDETRAEQANPPTAGDLPPEEGPTLPPLSPVESLTFDVKNESLWVHSPLLGTSLAERAHKLIKTSIKGSSVTLVYEDQFACTPQKTLEQDVSYFQARLENTRSFRVYKQGKFTEAAHGFHRAMQLDEGYGKARTNYVAALCRAGDVETAKNAFSAALKKDPLTTYEKLLGDSDFEPLRAELRTKSKVQPVLSLVHDELPPYAGYSKERGLLSVVRKQVSWGAENWTAELHIFDAQTRKLVSKHTLVRWHDVNEDGSVKPALKKEVSSRLERFNEALTALQFRPLPPGMRAEFNRLASGRGRVEAPLASLGQSIVAENNMLRLVRGSQVLDTFQSNLKGARPSVVYAVPEMNALIYFGAYEVAEGCDSGPDTLLEVFTTDHLAQTPR